MSLSLRLFLSLFFLNLLVIPNVYAEENEHGIERATGPKLSAAIGHYTRARKLLLTALKEFDRGAQIASPEVLIDIEEWRTSINDRAEDLKIIIAPQPRITKDGVQYDADIKIFDNKK